MTNQPPFIIIGASKTYDAEYSDVPMPRDVELLLTKDEYKLLVRIVNGLDDPQLYREELEAMCTVRRLW